MKKPGFTLLEVTLVVGLLSVLLMIALAIAFNAVGRTALRSAGNILIQSVRRAQTLAQNNVRRAATSGSGWGVYICPGDPVPGECSGISASVVIFERDAFSAVNVANDQVFDINPNIAVSGTLYDKMTAGPPAKKGLVFTAFRGEASPANFSGTLLFSMGGETREITVSNKGVVEQ